ncbi:hypothetical protein EJ02DRAFT_452317 [Clathrospora elynae]|uniref:Mitochondrial carrier protein pet8 n=1 Tax=Clathrospora elynae TaxID=706981 RepID=A0A6A5T5W1_9PLEO|nr:hypothetical protein EJ02DRAFT_452317 [Clathrospora elynae]
MSAIRAFAPRRAPFVLVQRAQFSQSRARASGKESSLHSEGRAEEVEKKKNEQLRKQRDGKGHWEEQLASDSESIVKADREETGKDTKQQIKELQDKSTKAKGQ